jgi:hypothetical protein
MLSFVVENNTSSPNAYPKSPRHLILNKLIANNLLNLLLKHSNSRFINTLKGDNLYHYCEFFNYANKFTISVNLLLTAYYTLISIFLKKDLHLACDLNSVKYIFQRASIVALPINGRVNNFTLILFLMHNFNVYAPLYIMLFIKREYIFV